MNLRKLDIKDAPLMLEWMHDPSVVEKMNTDFSKKTLADCQRFIINSQSDETNMHMAIVDEDDTYLGTVSLKNINREYGLAEFAITIRKCAMGRGVSKYGMSEIIRYAFDKLNLKGVYWCVSADNKRAIRFYDKNGYNKVPYEKALNYADYSREFIENHLWYEVRM